MCCLMRFVDSRSSQWHRNRCNNMWNFIKHLLTDQLLKSVLAEAQVVCVGQPPVVVGDLNADLGVVLCLAKGIASGRFIDLALAYFLGAGKEPDATCRFKLDEGAGITRDFVLVRWLLLLLVRSRMGGSLLTSLSSLVVLSAGGVRLVLAPVLLRLSGPLAGLTRLIGLLLLCPRLFRMLGIFIGRSWRLCHRSSS